MSLFYLINMSIWDDAKVLAFLESNPGYGDFVSGKNAGIIYTLEGVDFLIYREDTSVRLFYPAPYNPNIDYTPIEGFFGTCRRLLIRILNEAANNRLML